MQITSRYFGEGKTILDHAHPLSFDPAIHAKPGQDPRGVAVRLMYGMNACYQSIKQEEKKIPQRSSAVSSGSNLFGTDELLIHSCFDWYAVNACRYFIHLGYFSDQFAGYEHKERLRKAREYRKLVCGRVLDYRNKVAAHFAEVDPLSNDNLADQLSSTMMSIQFINGRIRLPALRVMVQVGASSEEPNTEIAWTLTEFHEQVVLPRITGPVESVERPASAPTSDRGEARD